MAQFPANIDLSSLDGSNGFRISGVAAGDQAGWSVASAGDINRDGLADMIVGAPTADPAGFANAGEAYVVFGKASGFGSNLLLSNLNGNSGFRMRVRRANRLVGSSVATAGDLIGNGFANLLIGGLHQAYVVFGKTVKFSTTDLATLDGSNGFTLSSPIGNLPLPAASAGDVNGDGLDDLIVGQELGGVFQPQSGSSYVVFGKPGGGYTRDVDLSGVNGNNGFNLNGHATGDRAGHSVASAGDVNGDGFADVIVGAPDADPNGSSSGASYLVFGAAGGFAANIRLSSLNGSNGVRLIGVAAGDQSGLSVASAGDVNGDGFADVIVGAPFADPHGSNSGTSYVLFGKAGGFTANLFLSGLNGRTGFRLNGAAAGDQSGFSVASAGDVNGDGFADVVVGANGADAGYVVFGKASGFSADIDLSSLDGSNGFKLSGVAGDRSGFSVASAGDVNGDGFADLIVGAPGAELGGQASGASFVVFGIAPDAAVDRVGTNASQTLAGGAFNDTLTGLGGDDGLYGNGGDDTLDGGPGNDRLLGGAGNDTASYTDATAGIFISLAIGGGQDTHGAGTDTLNSIENLIGTAFDDSLRDNGAVNVLAGGSGDDSYFVSNTADQVIEAVGGGYDIVRAKVDYALAAGQEIEVLRVDGSAGLALTGNEFANRLIGGVANDTLAGGAGNDMLNGGVGADLMTGGNGDDIYHVDNAGDQVIESVGGGYDTVYTTVNFALATGQEVELLRANAAAGFTLDGNEFDNRLIGATSGAFDDQLSAFAGNDTIYGYGGNDLLDGGSGDDLLKGGDGNDTMLGGDGDDRLQGEAGIDTLDGGAGNDTLIGGPGRDIMTGGLGADLFTFQTVADFGGNTTSTGDRILDFSAAESDLFDLSAVDAFTFIGTADFSGVAGQLRTFQQAGDTYFAGDLTGNSTADFMVRVDGLHTLTAGNFAL